MFSTAGTTATTFTFSRSSAMARMAPSTPAPPHMSIFILSMPGGGLSEMPPVANITPLPTSAIGLPLPPL